MRWKGVCGDEHQLPPQEEYPPELRGGQEHQAMEPRFGNGQLKGFEQGIDGYAAASYASRTLGCGDLGNL